MQDVYYPAYVTGGTHPRLWRLTSAITCTRPHDDLQVVPESGFSLGGDDGDQRGVGGAGVYIVRGAYGAVGGTRPTS